MLAGGHVLVCRALVSLASHRANSTPAIYLRAFDRKRCGSI
jgi:hypothetical protein